MTMKRLTLTAGDLPPKVNIAELQAKLTEITGGTAFASSIHEVTGKLREIHIDYPEEFPPDLKAVRASVKAHAPRRDDREEFEHRKQQGDGAVADLRREIEQLKNRVEALEGGQGRR